MDPIRNILGIRRDRCSRNSKKGNKEKGFMVHAIDYNDGPFSLKGLKQDGTPNQILDKLNRLKIGQSITAKEKGQNITYERTS